MTTIPELARVRRTSFEESLKFCLAERVDGHPVMIGFENVEPEDVQSDFVAFPFSMIEEPINDHIYYSERFRSDQHNGMADFAYRTIIKPSGNSARWLMNFVQLNGYGRTQSVGQNDKPEYLFYTDRFEKTIDRISTHQNQTYEVSRAKITRALRELVMKLDAPVRLTMGGYEDEIDEHIIEEITNQSE